MISWELHKRLQAATGELDLRLQVDLEPGTLLALYGASGAGKTSTLRMLAGLMRPDAGKIVVAGSVWVDTGRGIFLGPRQRSIGFVFQDYGLFPNMTVRQNLEFALPKGGDPGIVSRLIDAVELGNLRDRRPTLLSGGQQQRVALARALVQQPQLLLLDEPLSALDEDMRRKLQHYLLRVHQDFGLTTVLVSHNQAEVTTLADRVLVLQQGTIGRQGTPREVFGTPGAGTPGSVLAVEKNATEAVLRIRITRESAEEFSPGDRLELPFRDSQPATPRKPSSGDTPTPGAD